MTLTLSDILFPLKALLKAMQRFNNKNGWVYCSHMAMSLLMALFPFILFIISLAGFLSQNIPVSDVNNLIFGAWPDAIARPIEAEVRSVVEGASTSLLTFGGLFAIYFASNGIDAIRLAMTSGYRETDPRPFYKTRLIAIAFVVVGALVVVVSAAMQLALPIYLEFFQKTFPIAAFDNLSVGGLRFANWLLTGLFLVGMVTAFHMWLPGHRIPLRQALPGVALTIFLWVAGGRVFAYYLSHFATYGATYAGLAGVIATLIFLYFMAAILIVGAEFNGILIAREKEKQQEDAGED
ncbi:YihY/virulence factor BrkB family protein [Chachezhania sediminis]|uniref:YihY/virulence factor BrkB family protein n=1 Tax=Chachezhania sediminis TaxID=2599291 RepID=UPI00131BA800|nr:YihY/virulence factor BrkB family protein [Chachezhania sediminis]